MWSGKEINKKSVLIYCAICAVFLLTTCLTPSILVTKEQNKGDAFFNQHKYAEAIEHYGQMLDASRKLGIYRNISMESEVCRKIANGYEMMGNYDAAMESVRMAMTLDSIDNNSLSTIEDYRHEGKIYVYMGSYFNGIASLERSLALGEGMDQSLKNTNRLSIADTYLALGQLYAVMGRSENALDYTIKSLNIFSQAGDQRGNMESYLTLATIYSDQGEIITAKRFIERSLKIAIDIKMGTARHNQLLATLSSSLGEYENALRYQEKALEEAKRYGIVAQIIWATIGLGDIYSELGDLDQAEKFYNAAKEAKDTLTMSAGSLEASLGLRMGDVTAANKYFSSQGSITGKGISLFRMAYVMMQKEESDSALIFLNEAGGSFNLAGNIQGLAKVRILKGKIFIDRGYPQKAEPVLDSALNGTEFPETIWQAYYQKGRMYERLNQDDKAIESYRNSIYVIEKMRGNLTIDEFKSVFFDSKREVYDKLIKILLRNNKPVEAFQFSEQARARAFYDIIANKKIDFKGSLPGDLISLEQEKRFEMQNLYKLLQRGDEVSNAPANQRNEDIIQLKGILTQVQNEYEEILRKIKLNNPSYAEVVSADPVQLSELQSRLDTGTAVLAYWISDQELISWLVTRTGAEGRIAKIKKYDLDDLIEKARRSIQSNAEATATTYLSILYKLLIAPVEKTLADFENILIIPNGSLHFLPFQALINGNGEYLVQNYNLIYSPSASVYIVGNDREVKPGSRFMGLALSDIIVDDKTGLPGTYDELKKILPLFSDNISAFGSQGTETFVKNNISDFNFIHFATHGSYNYTQPLYSYLLFPPSDEDDGRLNVYEVFEMNLNAKLVTLSACETGLGNISQGDEITGLSRAFLFAGSSSVLVSLWAVADYPTALLMTNFYRYLRDHDLKESLTLAQRDVIKTYPQPLYWSPFILIGNCNVSVMKDGETMHR
jgi:CHAT domain-containing protein/Tfp pilus assembly protein PilF